MFKFIFNEFKYMLNDVILYQDVFFDKMVGLLNLNYNFNYLLMIFVIVLLD